MAQPFSPQIAVPAFFSDGKMNTGDHRADFDTLKSLAPAVAIVVLDVGISQQRDQPNFTLQPWIDRIKAYQGKGMCVLGYINTDSGRQTGILTKNDICGKLADPNYKGPPGYIEQWYNLFPSIDGIFFDIGPYPDYNPVTANVKQFYHDIYGCVQKEPIRTNHPQLGGNTTGPTVFLNAAGYNENGGDWIMAGPVKACDVALLVEDTWKNYVDPKHYKPGNWWTNYSPERIGHTIHHCAVLTGGSVPQSREPESINRGQSVTLMRQAVQMAKQRGAGYVYVFDDGGPLGPNESTSYRYLAQYWIDEVMAVEGEDIEPGATLYGDGRLVAFTRGTDNAIWHRWQVTRNGNWSAGWESIGAPPNGATSGPAATLNAPGGLVAFVRGQDGAIWHCWQNRMNGNWSGWESLGAV